MLLRFVVYIMWIGANIFVVLVVCSLYGNNIGDAAKATIRAAWNSRNTNLYL